MLRRKSQWCDAKLHVKIAWSWNVRTVTAIRFGAELQEN
jgi:hypothetical protein